MRSDGRERNTDLHLGRDGSSGRDVSILKLVGNEVGPKVGVGTEDRSELERKRRGTREDASGTRQDESGLTSPSCP